MEGDIRHLISTKGLFKYTRGWYCTVPRVVVNVVDPRNLHLKIGENWVSNSGDIFVVVVVFILLLLMLFMTTMMMLLFLLLFYPRKLPLKVCSKLGQ